LGLYDDFYDFLPDIFFNLSRCFWC